MRNRHINPPPLPPQLRKILGQPLKSARAIASRLGYRVEVLVPGTKVNIWGEEEQTGWVITPSSYAADKINVELDENGNVLSFNL